MCGVWRAGRDPVRPPLSLWVCDRFLSRCARVPLFVCLSRRRAGYESEDEEDEGEEDGDDEMGASGAPHPAAAPAAGKASAPKSAPGGAPKAAAAKAKAKASGGDLEAGAGGGGGAASKSSSDDDDDASRAARRTLTVAMVMIIALLAGAAAVGCYFVFGGSEASGRRLELLRLQPLDPPADAALDAARLLVRRGRSS